MDEYAVSVEGNVVTAYIASEAGQVCSCTIYYAYVFISYLAQRFEIIWEVGECDESARAELRMDGNFVRQRLHNHRSGGREHTFNGVQVDHTSFRPFVFQEVAFTGMLDSLSSSPFTPPISAGFQIVTMTIWLFSKTWLPAISITWVPSLSKSISWIWSEGNLMDSNFANLPKH